MNAALVKAGDLLFYIEGEETRRRIRLSESGAASEAGAQLAAESENIAAALRAWADAPAGIDAETWIAQEPQTEFSAADEEVFRAAARIPPGEVRMAEDIAEELGMQYEDVAAAVSRAALVPLVPVHRIRTHGSGAAEERLLAAERSAANRWWY